MLLFKEMTRRLQQHLFARSQQQDLPGRRERAQSFVVEKWEVQNPAQCADFKALKIPRLSELNLSHAEVLTQKGEMFLLGKDRYLMLAHNTQLSKSGRNISVVHGRSIRSPNEYLFVAYPELRDRKLFRKASLSVSLGAGPGDYFHGSLGVIELLVEKGGIANISFIQSSVNMPKAIQRAIMPETYRRLYSGWAASLISNVFAAAAASGWSLVQLPKGRVAQGLGEAQLNKLARPWGYRIAAFNPDHQITEVDSGITFVRVFNKNCQSCT